MPTADSLVRHIGPSKGVLIEQPVDADTAERMARVRLPVPRAAELVWAGCLDAAHIWEVDRNSDANLCTSSEQCSRRSPRLAVDAAVCPMCTPATSRP